MKLTPRQVAVLRRATSTDGPACTTWLTPSDMTVAQTYAVVRRLESKGLIVRHRPGSTSWKATSSGRQWLRSLDAGRPWMVRGWKRSPAA